MAWKIHLLNPIDRYAMLSYGLFGRTANGNGLEEHKIAGPFHFH